MPDPRFHRRRGPFTVATLAELCGARLAGADDPLRQVADVAPLEAADAETVSFLDNPRYVGQLANSRAGACILRQKHAAQAPSGMVLLVSEAPYKAYAQVAARFYPVEAPAPGVDASARIHPTARLGEGCSVAAGAVIEADAIVGPRCRIGANAVIGRAVVVGADCTIGALASLSHCLLGDRVAVYPGARLGQDGFGFAPDPGGHIKVPQLGRVVVGDDVEIGANSTIDRGAGPDTVIGPGCWIDNLVQIAHNVVLGRGCIVVAQSGISGSTKLGDFVVVGGQVGIAGHVTIGDGARLAAHSGVFKDIPAGRTVGGSPAVPVRAWHRQTLALARLGERKDTIDE